MSDAKRRLADMGLALPPDGLPHASFVKAPTWDGLPMLSGQICEWKGDPRGHARTAVCVASLPVNAAVEVDAIIAAA